MYVRRFVSLSVEADRRRKVEEFLHKYRILPRMSMQSQLLGATYMHVCGYPKMVVHVASEAEEEEEQRQQRQSLQ